MLTLTALRDPEYLISSVALGLDEYYAGVGEAPGVWAGRFAAELGLEGMVDADELRAVVQGLHPVSGHDLLGGRPERRVNAFDATFSAPKSASVLWATGSPEVASVVSRCHTEAVSVALSVLEDKAAVARQQTKGVRRRVATAGFAVATFAHRTSREGDPQLHTHCLIANVVRRPDGSYVAFDANPLHDWAKAAGSIYQAEIQRLLSLELGVAWGPERNGCREMVGFGASQLRAFSKRSVAIEAELEASGATWDSPAARMRADDAASLATRPAKDHSLTPTLLAERWQGEARGVGLEDARAVEAAVVGRSRGVGLTAEEVVASLLDPDAGLCATDARFTEAKVVERICAASAGRLTTNEILELAGDFLASEHVVRLVPEAAAARRRPPEWSTVAHRQLENEVLEHVGRLKTTPVAALEPEVVEAALAGEGRLGADQAAAVRALCGHGAALRGLIAPAGFGKTTAVHAAAAAASSAGRPVLGVATTNQAVAGLRGVGLEAMTIARLRSEMAERPLALGMVLVLDEVSQVSTRDAATVVSAVVGTAGGQLWCLGDARQSQAVGAGGLAGEIERLAAEGEIVAPALVVNRRQRHLVDQAALAELRTGNPAASQTLRTDQGWEHEEPTPLATREALADAVVGDIGAHGAEATVALAVSHADCEDLADRIRARLLDAGVVHGASLGGPGWGSGPGRSYATGDRVLLHAKPGAKGLHNGSTGTVVAVDGQGLRVAFDVHGTVALPTAFVSGRRSDGNPNISHAWARTIEGAQGGTWEAVHLLGSASLDALVGYTGQSRGRAPTHTWNTRRLVAVEHGGLPADDRSATEVVLAGLCREPVTTFAAADDPWVLDSRLSAERDEHLAVLTTAPPDLRASLRVARAAAERASRVAADAFADLQRAQAHLAGLGALAGLRRSGRDERARAEAAVLRAHEAMERAQAAHRAAASRLEVFQDGEDRRVQFVADTAWRFERVRAINAELDRHWSAATLVAVRQDDPLAFGVERLRAARTAAAGDLARYYASLPPNRGLQLQRAQQDLADAQSRLRQARGGLDGARRRLTSASQRSWGRRDKPTMYRAASDVRHAEDELRTAFAVEQTAQSLLQAEMKAEARRAEAMAASTDQRTELVTTLSELNAALDDTRTGRVAAMATEGAAPSHLLEVLGEVPCDPRARQAWRALAWRVECYRDRHPDAVGHEAAGGVVGAIGPRQARQWMPDPEWDDLATQIRNGRSLVAICAEIDSPGAGRDRLEDAAAIIEARRASAERALEREQGLEIGW